jgi:hypothetical protein
MNYQPKHTNGIRRTVRLKAAGFGMLAVLAAAILPVTGQRLLQSGVQSPQSPPAANDAQPASGQAPGQQQAVKPQTVEDASADSRKKVAADTALLLKLAGDLKAEVDKTTKDTLSVTVVRKADAIEQLAHKVRGNR